MVKLSTFIPRPTKKEAGAVVLSTVLFLGWCEVANWVLKPEVKEHDFVPVYDESGNLKAMTHPQLVQAQRGDGGSGYPVAYRLEQGDSKRVDNIPSLLCSS